MPESKVVTIGYGIFNNANRKKIEKEINKRGKQGFKLISRQDKETGCLVTLFTMGWARGKTELTFFKDD